MQMEPRASASPSPTMRAAAISLASFAIVLLAGTALDDNDAIPPFPVILVPLFTVVVAGYLIVYCFWSAWRLRRQRLQAAVAVVTPVAAIGLGAAIFFAIWAVRGVPPLVRAGTNDVQIDQTLTSPDGRLRAVVLDDLSGGPATGASKDIYVLPHADLFFPYADRIFSLECSEDFRVRWVGPRTLEVSYKVGQDGLTGDGVYQPPPWTLRRLANSVKVRVIREVVRQPSLC
jgi:hypothetical protein